MFGIGPAYLFLIQHRLPVGFMRNGWQPWASTMLTNLGVALIVAALVWLIGIKAFLFVHLPIMLLAARPACGCSMYSINLSTRCGTATGIGVCTMRPCTQLAS